MGCGSLRADRGCVFCRLSWLVQHMHAHAESRTAVMEEAEELLALAHMSDIRQHHVLLPPVRAAAVSGALVTRRQSEPRNSPAIPGGPPAAWLRTLDFKYIFVSFGSL